MTEFNFPGLVAKVWHHAQNNTTLLKLLDLTVLAIQKGRVVSGIDVLEAVLHSIKDTDEKGDIFIGIGVGMD